MSQIAQVASLTPQVNFNKNQNKALYLEQILYGSLKTWKVMEFKNYIFQTWKSKGR